MRIPNGFESQRERENETKCWEPSLKILRAEVPNQVPQTQETGSHADISVGDCGKSEAAHAFVSNVSGFDLQRIDERNRSVRKMCVDEEDWGFAVDDLSGVDLPLDLVVASRKEEMDHMLGHTFHIVDKAECHAKTGKSPISTRWIDTPTTLMVMVS